MAHLEKSYCHWVPYHTRQRILSAIALTVEELGIGDALKNAVQSGPGPLIVKVCINTKKIWAQDLIISSWPDICTFRYRRLALMSFRSSFQTLGQLVSSQNYHKSSHSQQPTFCRSAGSTIMDQPTTSGIYTQILLEPQDTFCGERRNLWRCSLPARDMSFCRRILSQLHIPDSE